MKLKNEYAENIFGNLITLIIPVWVKTFAVAVHLICILLHDAVKEKERERKNMKAGENYNNRKKKENRKAIMRR